MRRVVDEALAAILRPDREEQAWWHGVLDALALPVQATLATAWRWEAGGQRWSTLATLGETGKGEGLISAILALPPQWRVRLHRLPRAVMEFRRAAARLPAQMRNATTAAVHHASAGGTVLLTAPHVTGSAGCGVLLVAPRRCGPRARATLSELIGYVKASLALRRAERLPTKVAASGVADAQVWRDWLSGGWSLVRAELEGEARSLILVRTRGAGDPRSLTSRELHVVTGILAGHSNKWIGWELGIASSTVAGHLSTALAKLGLRSRAELFSLFGRAEAAQVSAPELRAVSAGTAAVAAPRVLRPSSPRA